jgi:hypothetical protein
MRKLILGLFFVLAGAVNAFGQSTTVSGQVTDAGAQAWDGGVCQFQFVPNPNTPTFQSYTWTGGALPQVVPCTMNGSGAYSVSVPSNTSVSPGGSKWILQVTPNATSPSFRTPATTITGGTQTLNVTPPAIAISWSIPPGPAISAYADGEIVGTLPDGAEYFNTTTGLTRLWNGSAWINQGSGAGGSVTGTGTANTIAKWTSGTAIGNSGVTDNGTTVSTPENFQALGGPSTLSTIIAGTSQLNGITVTGASGTTVTGLEPGQTLTLDGDSGIRMNINSGRVAVAGDFVDIGNTSTGLISGIAQGPTSADTVQVTPSATSVLAEESGAVVNINASGLVDIVSLAAGITLTPASGQLISLGTDVTVGPATSVFFSNCALGERQDRVPTASTDTILATDRCGRVAYNASGAVAVTLPNTTTTGFGSEFYFYVSNANTASSAVTITPTGTTINGLATLVLNLGDFCFIGENTAGTAYNANCMASQLVAGSGITLTPAAHGLTIAASGGSSAFSALTSGTNTTAAMVVGTGASLASVPQFNIGAVGTAGVLGLVGSTSGTATITAPAVAGTNTNPIVFSNAVQMATANPALIFNAEAFYPSAAGVISWDTTGTTDGGSLYSSGVRVVAAAGYDWSSTTSAIGTPDTGFGRLSAGVVSVDTGSIGNALGSLTGATLTGKTALTAGVVGTTAGLLNLSGSTSGTATLTAPAVAGTTSNAVVSSNNLSAPVLVSTVATGTAPFTVTSTTAVTNLNSSTLLGNTWASPGGIGGGTPGSGLFTTLTGRTSVTAGVVGTTAGLLNLSGSTSGTATLTAPAVAGTTSNFVVSSNSLQISSTVSGSTPQLSFNDGTSGFQQSAAGVWKFYGAGTDTLALAANILRVNSTTGYQFSSGGSSSGTADTGLGRSAAGIISADTGTIGNGLGTFIATAYQTKTNCANGSTPAACGSAASGAVAIPTGATPTLVVDTSAVTATSRIILTVDESLTIPSTTCNTTLATLTQPVVTARTAGTSFTIQTASTIATNPVCVSYLVVN